MIKNILLVIILSFCVISCSDDELNNKNKIEFVYDEFIVNGIETNHDKFPSIVGIATLNENKTAAYHWCTGTLIKKDLVLTAAHCVKNKDVNKIFVYYGYSKLDEVCSECFNEISRSKFHEKYNETAHEIWYDIGIFLLKNKLQNGIVSEILQPSYYEEFIKINDIVTVAGYGIDEESIGGVLRYGNVPIIKIPNEFEILVSTKYTPNPCYGDSGGPIYVKNQYVTGIASRKISSSHECDEGNVIYTLPGMFIDWIEDSYEEFTHTPVAIVRSSSTPVATVIPTQEDVKKDNEVNSIVVQNNNSTNSEGCSFRKFNLNKNNDLIYLFLLCLFIKCRKN